MATLPAPSITVDYQDRFFRSEITGGMYDDERSVAWLQRNTPLPYQGGVDDFVGVGFVSDGGRYVTGQTVVVDGGWTAR